MSYFQSTFFSSPTVYPNSVIWSEENLVAVACSGAVVILNPHRPKVRGVITVTSRKPFPIGNIDGGGGDLLNGCLLPYHLSRETRPCVRSISWSPAGLASNAGCLIAVCTTGGHVKLYCHTHCSSEWLEVMDVSEMLYNYYMNTNFGECQIVPLDGSEIIRRHENADHECTRTTPLINDQKRRRQTQKAANVMTTDREDLEENTLQIVPVFSNEEQSREELTEDRSLALITSQQYACRSEMLMSLTVAWSPILEASGDGVVIPHNSSNQCSILAVGGRCGRISFWRTRAPESYSSDNTRNSVEVLIVGLLTAHSSWITAISWAVYGSNVSKAQLILATGSSDGSFKIWQVDGKNLLNSSGVSNDSFSLLKEIVTVDSAPISVLSLAVPSQSPTRILLAVGKGSGSFELWILDTSSNRYENVGCYNAHDRTVVGLTWAFDGRCLYSCGQDNSMKSWVLVGDSLCEVPIPSSSPGLKSSPDFSHALDSCFGLAVSPANLAVVVARTYDTDLLDQMYEARTHRASIEFVWIGGQQLDLSSPTSSEINNKTFPGFSQKELIWWEANILWSLNQYKNPNRLLNILDIVAALLAFNQSAPKFVERILLKWLASCLGPDFETSPSFPEALKVVPKLSSRELHLINIVSRRVVLKEFTIGSGKEDVLEGLSNDKKEYINLWRELLCSCENELRWRLVSISFSAGSSEGLPQMGQWVLQNEIYVKDHSTFLAAEIRKMKKRKSKVSLKHGMKEHCNFCSAEVPFKSAEYAICSGAKNDNGVNQTHKMRRCAVTMRILPLKLSWYCMCCQGHATELAPALLFVMTGYPSDFESFIESKSSAYKDSLTPCCPFCGILVRKPQPQYFLSPSPL